MRPMLAAAALAGDDGLAQKRYEQVNASFRKEIESVAEELKRKY